jgi:hypothetical protein
VKDALVGSGGAPQSETGILAPAIIIIFVVVGDAHLLVLAKLQHMIHHVQHTLDAPLVVAVQRKKADKAVLVQLRSQ